MQPPQTSHTRICDMYRQATAARGARGNQWVTEAWVVCPAQRPAPARRAHNTGSAQCAFQQRPVGRPRRRAPHSAKHGCAFIVRGGEARLGCSRPKIRRKHRRATAWSTQYVHASGRAGLSMAHAASPAGHQAQVRRRTAAVWTCLLRSAAVKAQVCRLAIQRRLGCLAGLGSAATSCCTKGFTRPHAS